MYLEHSFTTTAQAGGDSHFCNNYGHALIRECELEIGQTEKQGFQVSEKHQTK